MNVSEAVDVIASVAADPRRGLPEEVFLLISRLVPMVNVDLLIQDEKQRTLLTWRDDSLHGPGWHVPGGMIRYQETMADRVRATARAELGAEVIFGDDPVAIHQIILPEQRERTHFISLLFRCSLKSGLDESLSFKTGVPMAGQWAWLDGFPDNMIPVHHIYRRFFPH